MCVCHLIIKDYLLTYLKYVYAHFNAASSHVVGDLSSHGTVSVYLMKKLRYYSATVELTLWFSRPAHWSVIFMLLFFLGPSFSRSATFSPPSLCFCICSLQESELTRSMLFKRLYHYLSSNNIAFERTRSPMPHIAAPANMLTDTYVYIQ